MNVYDWCSKLHKLKDELKGSGEKERVTTIRVESVEDFKEACSKVGASCEILESVQEKVSHHGGSYYVEKKMIRIKFKHD